MTGNQIGVTETATETVTETVAETVTETVDLSYNDFCEIRWLNEVQLNTEVYSSFASIYINNELMVITNQCNFHFWS